ncbi:MAG: PQQ-binding-like beta-propeller repeat protein [Kiritimatiellae bacterium]|nr:PQQ-binding-like beta-propeller repeat protein [Kiritimatiellia bacterium]
MSETPRIRRFVLLAVSSACACCCLMLPTWGLADDWPQWRGPNRNGISAETGWLQTWPPMTVWTQSVGEGFSGASISDGRVYTAGYSGGRDVVYCLDEATGARIWTNSYACGTIGYDGPRATPAVVGDEVYTYSHEGHLNCWNKLTGALLWSKLVNAGRNSSEGLCGSPMVHGNLVLLNAGGSGTAVDRNAPHNIVWTSSGGATHTSPWLMTWNSQPTMVLLGDGRLIGLNPANGAVRWQYAWNAVNCADPVLYGDAMFLSSSYGKGCALAQLGGSTLSSVWVNMNMENHFTTSTRVGQYVYGFHGRQGNSGTSLRCIDLQDGSVEWSRNDLGLYHGFVIAADGKLILLGERGDLTVALASPSGFNAEGRSSIEVIPNAHGQRWWTVPSLANGKIYCRSHQGALVCLQVGGSGPAPPAAPGDLSATALSASEIRVSWSDNSSKETCFKLDRRQSGASDWVRMAEPDADTTGYTDSGLPAETKFYYKVKAWNSAGNSAYSNMDDATTLQRTATRGLRIAAGMDDVEERGDGSVYTDSSDLELTEDVSGVQTIGLRFVGLDVPPGATIAHAHVQFKVDESGSTGTTLTIRGEHTGKARAFTTNAYDVTTRPLTDASVAWSVPAWNTVGQAGADQRTPDLAAVIQAIVGHDRWRPGNALALIVTGTGKRTAEAWEGDSLGAPELVVEYRTGLVDDIDGDGVSDAWEIEQFGGTNVANAAPGEDYDGDGYSNWEEFVAGTDPTAGGESYFGVIVALEVPHIVVSFPTIVATGTGYEGYQRYYDLQKSNPPPDENWAGVPGYTNLLATGGTVRFTNTLGAVSVFRARAWLE